MVFFKALSAKVHSSGDAYWVSSNGEFAIVIDAVSLSHQPEETKEILLKYLHIYEDILSSLDIEEILQKLNAYLYDYGNGSMMAVVGGIKNVKKYFNVAWVGNVQLYAYTTTERTELISASRQPENVIGQHPNIEILGHQYPVEDSTHYVLSTDGLTFEANDCPDFSLFQSDFELINWSERQANEKDWTLLVFPFESIQTHENSSWPYDPFIGLQEDRDHEKRGLSLLADALFEDDNFNGFKIVGGGYIAKQDSTRMLDGILVSPYGILLLELKDHRGNITISTINRGKMVTFDPNTDYHKTDTSPYAKLNDILTVFSEQEIVKSVMPEIKLRRTAAVIFTHTKASVTVQTVEGDKSLPERIGNIIISTPSQLPVMMKQYIKSNLGKRYKKISSEEINRISLALKGDANNDTNKKTLIKNRYTFNASKPLKEESTEYYTLYIGEDIRRKKQVWIKKYKLSTMTRKSIEEEAERIGREADALKEFQGCKEIQDYYDSEHMGESHYVILEKVQGVTLEKWIEAGHTQQEKLDLLMDIADVVSEIETQGIPHRALNNQNFRISQDNEIHLINFELCKIDYLPTLPPNERRALSSRFEAKEVNTVVNQTITTAADIYSFALIICYVLAEEILITSQTHKKFIRNNNNWIELAERCNIDYLLFQDIQPAFDTISKKRPSAEKLKNILQKWRDEC